MFQLNDNICAISTPLAPSAIGSIRCSGPNVFDLLAPIIKKNISTLSGYQSGFARFYKGDEVLDEIVFTLFKAPKSFTGENVVELSFHGSPYILTEALHILIDAGFRSAGRGEFSYRAYSNGKMDLSQTEAIADIISSENAASHRLAMNQLRGGYSEMIDNLKSELIDFASLVELELDFAEEDVEFANRDEFLKLVNTIINTCDKLCSSFKLGNAIKKGVPVSIIGRPNAGKSTLLNALLKEERAIVSDIEGTTRDTIEDTCTIGGIGFRFIDTAGIRETSDEIEQAGITRARKALSQSDLALMLYNANSGKLETEIEELQEFAKGANALCLFIANKIDLNPDFQLPENHISISAKHQKGIEALENKIAQIYKEELKGQSADFTLTNLRHYEAFKNTKEALEEVITGLENELPTDLIAIDIRRAINELGSITGAITTDDLLGNIFANFCIGK